MSSTHGASASGRNSELKGSTGANPFGRASVQASHTAGARWIGLISLRADCRAPGRERRWKLARPYPFCNSAQMVTKPSTSAGVHARAMFDLNFWQARTNFVQLNFAQLF